MNTWIVGKDLTKNKKAVYSKLNLKDNADEDYAHAQKVWEVSEINNLGEYHDLYVQSSVLLLDDVFEDFRNKRVEIYELYPAYSLSASRLAWQACLKMVAVELEFLTDINMLLIAEKGIKGGRCDAIHRYAETNNKYMKN